MTTGRFGDFTGVELPILDDVGLQAFDNQDRETLMDIIDNRHGKKPTVSVLLNETTV